MQSEQVPATAITQDAIFRGAYRVGLILVYDSRKYESVGEPNPPERKCPTLGVIALI